MLESPVNLRLAIALLVLLAVVAVDGGGASALGPDDPAGRARSHLHGRAAELGLRPDLSDLRAEDVRSGLAGEYVRFQQTVDGVPVEGAQVVVALPSDPRREPVVVSRYESGWTPARGSAGTSGPEALRLAMDEIGGRSEDLRAEPTVEAVYLSKGRDRTLGWRVVLPLREPLGTWLVRMRAENGEVLSTTDLLRYDSGQVFDPNPARDSGGTIPPPTDCDSPENESLLAGEYVSRELMGIAGGQDKLKGEFVDLTAPGIAGGYKAAGQAEEPSRSYLYPCTDDRFEEVMVYHHVDAAQRKIQSLGFSEESGILDRAIAAHAHYFSDCNAFFDPVTEGIHFGDADTCGVNADSGEDGDVIVHEYGHAIQHDQIPGFGFGSAAEAEEAWSMGEGFGDFLTAAILGDACLAEWFSFGGSCLRDMENSNHYPEDYDACRPIPPRPAEPHCGGLIWGGALWDLVQALGGDQRARDLTLALVLESHFLMDPLSTFEEGAAAIRQADALLFGGAHVGAIDAVFQARGIGTLNGAADFSYAYLRILHPYRGDLDVDLLVGDTTSPTCSIAVWDPSPVDATDDLVGYQRLDDSACSGLLPPTLEQPWHLRVGDVFPSLTGTLEEFEVVLAGDVRCVATDVPLAIPDDGAFVFSTVDCSVVVSGLQSDTDGDGFDDAVEVYVGTDPAIQCGNDGWPADLVSVGLSENKLDLQDLVSFVAPLWRLNSSPGDEGFDIRWDIVPGGGVLSKYINITDLAQLVVLAPPMLGGERAFNRSCSPP
jgi:hypothetical protein